MTPPWPRGVGLHSCIHTFPSNPQNSPKQPGLRSVLSRSNFSVLIINITARKILGRIFYVLPYRWGNWDPYTQYTRVCPGSRPQPWSEDGGPHSDSQARALSSTGRCPPALAGWVIGTPGEDCRYLNKPELNIPAHSGAVSGLQAWSPGWMLSCSFGVLRVVTIMTP